MIADFESRFADVLGERLPAPFTGRVTLSPGTAPGADPQLIVGAREISLTEPDFGSVRPEIVPGAVDPRRVLRLDCTIGVDIRPAAGQGRPQQMRALDAALYTLDAPDFRDGSALNDATDRGFRIDAMRLLSGASPLDPAAAAAPVLGLTLVATGLFWPAGVPGTAGIAIVEIDIGGSVLPVDFIPPGPDLVAGGAAAVLNLRVRPIDPLRVGASGAPLPVGPLALAVFSQGGKPGKGALSGGAAGAPGVRLVPVANGAAAVTYTPPADPATDELVIALDDGSGGLGLKIGRIPLKVRGA